TSHSLYVRAWALVLEPTHLWIAENSFAMDLCAIRVLGVGFRSAAHRSTSCSHDSSGRLPPLPLCLELSLGARRCALSSKCWSSLSPKPRTTLNKPTGWVELRRKRCRREVLVRTGVGAESTTCEGATNSARRASNSCSSAYVSSISLRLASARSLVFRLLRISAFP